MKIIISTLLVITIISLATLTWQKYSIKAEYEQLNTNIAAILVNDITNRIYINYQGVTQGKASFYVEPVNLDKKKHIEQHVNYFCYLEDQGCPPNTVAANDLAYWKQAVMDDLPNGVGEIRIFDKNPYSYVISISWDDYNNKKKFVKTNIILPYSSS